MPKTITVIGSLNVDLVTRTLKVPEAGETVLGKSFDTGSGGKGCNQAVACARLSRSKHALHAASLDVRMVGAVGDDIFGADILRGLTENGISSESVQKKSGEKSGVAIVIVDEHTGDNRILVSPNANFTLLPQHFDTLPAPLPDLILLQLEIPYGTVVQILRAAQEKNVEVVLNPAPARTIPPEFLKLVTHLIMNESEAVILTGDGQVSNHESNDFASIRKLGVKHVCITYGSKGARYMQIEGEETRTRFLDAQKVDVKDTTAAGDTFAGAYAVGLAQITLRNFEYIADIVSWANACAGETVKREGAQSAISWRDEVPDCPTAVT